MIMDEQVKPREGEEHVDEACGEGCEGVGEAWGVIFVPSVPSSSSGFVGEPSLQSYTQSCITFKFPCQLYLYLYLHMY
jgi:hypothetical protein